MPYTFEVDWGHRIFRASFHGRVTDEDVKAAYQEAYQELFHIQSHTVVVNFAPATEFAVSSEITVEIAKLAPVVRDPTFVEIIIAANDESYQRAQLYTKWGSGSRPNLHVVRNEEDAWKILRIENPQFSPYSKGRPAGA